MFSPESFLHLCVEGSEHSFRVIKDGLPKDSKVIGAGYDHTAADFICTLNPESFPLIAPMEAIPIHSATVFQTTIK